MKSVVFIATIFLVIIGLFVAGQTQLLAKQAADASQTMLTANQLYETGQFDQAAQAYQQLVGRGITDSSLYYNLGNAYFKQGDIGRAILNYRRADRLAPRDLDIRTNLALARSQTVDQLEETGSEGLLSQLVHFVHQWLTTDELAIATLSLWFGVALGLIIISWTKAGSVFREGLQYLLIVGSLLLVMGLVSLSGQIYLESKQPVGVIVAHEVAITSGPGSHYVTEFTLHDGAEVIVVERRNNWVRLSLPGDQLQGWSPANAVEMISG